MSIRPADTNCNELCLVRASHLFRCSGMFVMGVKSQTMIESMEILFPFNFAKYVESFILVKMNN